MGTEDIENTSDLERAIDSIQRMLDDQSGRSTPNQDQDVGVSNSGQESPSERSLEDRLEEMQVYLDQMSKGRGDRTKESILADLGLDQGLAEILAGETLGEFAANARLAKMITQGKL